MNMVDTNEFKMTADAETRDSNWGSLSPMRRPGLRDVTVMMVDDEPMMTDVIQTYLEEAGYSRFVSVNDPLLALDVARRHRPGLLLLDLMMPGLSGFDILEQMRADEQLRYTPVIVLTAANNPATKLRALELGATEFLSKPVDASELVLRVRNSLVFTLYQDRLANLDLLTGLPNRRVFVDQLRNVMDDAHDRGTSLGLLYIGLDRFKQINATLGHRAGDQLLSDVAQRLQLCLRRTDSREDAGRGDVPRERRGRNTLFLSRLAGDEFAVLMPDLESPESAGRAASRVLAAMAQPFQHDGQEVYVTPSIGIAVYPGDGVDDETLRRNAESALSHAKDNGRNTFRYYSPALNGASIERLAIETRLRRAIERQELQLKYQPKVALDTGRIVGAEALLRWANPDLGLVSPDRFIPLAEESGLIVEIGEWVLNEACQQMAHWRDAGHGIVKVAINVSRQEVVSGGLVATVASALQRFDIGAGQLVVELTESMLMDHHEQTRAQLEALRALGVQLSIDDFGTGYSSMNYLKRFPLDELKIDKSFVQGTPDDPTNSAIVKAVIVLAHSLGMRVVAEGVETEASRNMLAALQCDLFQGYLCSRPVDADDFMALMNRTNAV